MRAISQRVRRIIDSDEFYRICSRWADGNCSQCVTMEHTLIYAGSQIDEHWAIIPLCEYHHGVGNYQDRGDLQKEKNVWIALNRATDEELLKYPKRDFLKEKSNLNKKYGKYTTL